MCECLKRDDGTWHVDECCAWIMDAVNEGHAVISGDSVFTQHLDKARREAAEEMRERCAKYIEGKDWDFRNEGDDEVYIQWAGLIRALEVEK